MAVLKVPPAARYLSRAQNGDAIIEGYCPTGRCRCYRGRQYHLLPQRGRWWRNAARLHTNKPGDYRNLGCQIDILERLVAGITVLNTNNLV